MGVDLNLWDDYYDDGYVPEGKCQETHMYIEEYDNLTDNDKTKIMKVVYDFIVTLDMVGVEVELDGKEIYFKHLTHIRREKLIKELELENAKLVFGDVYPFDFYSES